MIQHEILRNIQSRGYATGNVPETVKQQVLKSVEEMGEVARHIFDGHMPPVDELADVCIPMFCAAALLSYDTDLLQVMLDKSKGDIGRGVR
jgi:NTP pyrophosphatase (non-canonical NTP hydrolase)